MSFLKLAFASFLSMKANVFHANIDYRCGSISPYQFFQMTSQRVCLTDEWIYSYLLNEVTVGIDIKILSQT